jgi:hypothetical protein
MQATNGLPKFLALAGSAIDTIKINKISRQTRDYRSVWVKERRLGSRSLTQCANLFFRLANNPVKVVADIQRWQRREVDSFNLVNGDQYSAAVDGPTAICIDALPGTDLDSLAKRNLIDSRVLQAAANELFRVHNLSSKKLRAPWSHGDPNMGNFIYDRKSHRARLIDFETVHLSRLSADERHADDVSVFLLNLLGSVSDADWPEMAKDFITAYNRPRILGIVRRGLVMPLGIERLWWAIRTNYISGEALGKRLKKLHQILS